MKDFSDRTPKISLTVLASLCFVTLTLCQTRFKVSQIMSEEISPPILPTRDYWFLYSVGNPDRFKCVLNAFVLVSSPVISLISTGLLLFGKSESNPYFFIPWLLLTIKGLLLVQTDNLISILRDMALRSNYMYAFRLEDMKWFCFYSTIFLADLVEASFFYEMFDLFLVLWNHHPGYNTEKTHLEMVKTEIAEILDTMSKCSLGSLSKVSLGSLPDMEENSASEIKNSKPTVKFSLKDEKIDFEVEKPIEELEEENTQVIELEPNLAKKSEEEKDLKGSIKSLNFSEGDASMCSCNEFDVNSKASKKISSKENLDELNNTNLEIGDNVRENVSKKSFHSEDRGDSISFRSCY